MIELKRNALVFSFPDVHEDAVLEVHFQRTLRIPDDGRTHALPPGLGRFPLRHVDDHADGLPPSWKEHGGVMLPMYQAEALWICFTTAGYPFAVKVATGKIDALTGGTWSNDLHADPQDYLVTPPQPWLDGYCVEKGVIRQFVAMPLGQGHTAEEQLTGRAEHGGLQLLVHPLRGEAWRSRRSRPYHRCEALILSCRLDGPAEMGLAPGGRMRQEVYEDPHRFRDWDLTQRSRCYVHVANSLTWRQIAGSAPPGRPPTAAAYAKAGLPWFDWYDEGSTALEGAGRLAGLTPLDESLAAAAEVEGGVAGDERVIEVGPSRRSRRVREATT